MAQAKTIRFGQAYVMLQDQDTAALYASVCGVEELTMTINVESNTTNIPDCENPDLAAWLETDIVSQQMTLEGSGVLDTDAMQAWQDWWLNDGASARNVRFFRNLSAPNGGGHFTGPAKLTAYAESGTRGERWQQTFTLAMDGKPTFTAAS